MNKLLYSAVDAEDINSGEKFKLQYYLLEDELEIEACILKCYGFGIKKTVYGEKTELSEMKQIHNVCFNKNEATSFLKKICEKRVTPITLAEILGDYISDEIHCKNRQPVLV